MRLKLLEGNQTPSLEEMEKFAKRFRAFSQSDLMPLTSATKTTAGSDDGQLAQNIGKLQDTMTQLTAAVSAPQGRQEHLEATVSPPLLPRLNNNFTADLPIQDSLKRNEMDFISSLARIQVDGTSKTATVLIVMDLVTM